MVTISLREEATQLLSDLLRLDTVNPPGNETKAAELLAPRALRCRVWLMAKVPDRANLVARLRGRDEARPSCFFPTPTRSSRTPANGSTIRGAARCSTAMSGSRSARHEEPGGGERGGLATLAREGFEPAGDVLFAACADEEVGEDYGLSWLCQEHPDAVRVDYCINEGGGDRVEVDGRALYMCATGEKMSSPFLSGSTGAAATPRCRRSPTTRWSRRRAS